MIVTDSSDLAKEGILSQMELDKLWHPVAYYSKKFAPAELNYNIHDKEMVVIVDCFKEWRHFLIGCPHKIQLYTYHKNLEYFNSTKILNRRQARWAEILSEFDFVIIYRPGEKNSKAVLRIIQRTQARERKVSKRSACGVCSAVSSMLSDTFCASYGFEEDVEDCLIVPKIQEV